MMISLRRTLLPCVLLVGLSRMVLAAGDAPAVRDAAGFFTPATVQKANEDIAAFQKQYPVDLLIETVKSVPPDKAQQVQAMKPADRDKFFADWALEKARAAKLRGWAWETSSRRPASSRALNRGHFSSNLRPRSAVPPLVIALCRLAFSP